MAPDSELTKPSSDGLTHLTIPVIGIVNPVIGTGRSYPVSVIFAGQAPGFSAGLQQINLQIPATVPPGVYQLVLTAGATATQANATITSLNSRLSLRFGTNEGRPGSGGLPPTIQPRLFNG